MSKSKAPRVKSPEEIAQETEFYRRRNYAAVEVRIISATRSQDVYLTHHQLGNIGSMHRHLKHGKEVSVSYVLPKVKGRRYGDTFVSITPGEVEQDDKEESHADYYERRHGVPEYAAEDGD